MPNTLRGMLWRNIFLPPPWRIDGDQADQSPVSATGEADYDLRMIGTPLTHRVNRYQTTALAVVGVHAPLQDDDTTKL